MDLFKLIKTTQASGFIMPAAVALTFGTMMLTTGYMERVLNKKIILDIRIAKAKARFNAESGTAIAIAGPNEDGSFPPGIGSSDWPVTSVDGENIYESGVLDIETFPGVYKPENPSSFFPNASLLNTPNIEMGEFYIATQKLQCDLSRDDCRALFDRYDTNHDGVLDFTEFLLMMLAGSKKIKHQKKVKELEDEEEKRPEPPPRSLLPNADVKIIFDFMNC